MRCLLSKQTSEFAFASKPTEETVKANLCSDADKELALPCRSVLGAKHFHDGFSEGGVKQLAIFTLLGPLNLNGCDSCRCDNHARSLRPVLSAGQIRTDVPAGSQRLDAKLKT